MSRFRFGKLGIYLLGLVFLISFLHPDLHRFPTREWAKPDFPLHEESIEFPGPRRFALPRAGYYLLEGNLFRTPTSVSMLASPPSRAVPEEAPYFSEWLKYESPYGVGPTYGIRSLTWMKYYYLTYLLGENDIEIFKVLLGIDEPMIGFRKYLVSVKDGEMEHFFERLANYGEGEQGRNYRRFFRFATVLSDAGSASSLPIKSSKEIWNKLDTVDNENPGNFESRVVFYDFNRVKISVKTSTEGMMILRDGYSKHWRALVDGQDADVHRINVSSKGVWIASGAHNIELIFDPRFYKLSFALFCFLSFVGFPALIGYELRRSSGLRA